MAGVVTQAGFFDLNEGRKRRDEGIARVSSRNARWLDQVRSYAADVAARDGYVTSDQLQAVFRLPEGAHVNTWGAVFRDSRFELCGLAVTERPSGHSRRIFRWRLRQE